MQLIYLYIDEYCNFQKTGFNFSQDMNINLDEDKNVLNMSHMDSGLPKRFWGENINNLSVVIGNNGAGKTSLMQYLIDIFLELHGVCKANGPYKADGLGIVVFGDEGRMYGYQNLNREAQAGKPTIDGQIRSFQWLDRGCVESMLEKTKFIYLTNVLSVRDTRRSLWYYGDRYAPLYDCSKGNLIRADIERDMNRNLRKNPMSDSETEAYFFYEQYKQIKFVFDRQQHHICQELKDAGFPVPVPKVLYIDLLLTNQLNTVVDGTELDSDYGDKQLEWQVFQDLYPQIETEESYVYLWKQLSRAAIWCAVRSALRCMSGTEKEKFLEYLWHDERKTENFEEGYRGVFERMWNLIEQAKKITEGKGGNKKKENEKWEILEDCFGWYIDFLDNINPEILMKHFRIDEEEWETLKRHPDSGRITFTVDTDDAEWFIEFLQKYRYICNPDYFLDFRWGLSSGENSLLSLFASFYYIFDADYTNGRHGDYKIMNGFKQFRKVPCDSIILLIDEADLTYHPEWQRVFIDLLTAFLPKIYPPRCCDNIQIILSTHSPILLSDVPQKNVIYLKYNSEKRCTEVDHSVHAGTFGQNIHLLFKDSFFLEEGAIGSFAQGKINELVCNLSEIEKKIEAGNTEMLRESLEYKLEHECKLFAELIAEPIIREKAMMWIDTLRHKLSVQNQNDRIQKMTNAELEGEISRLQKELRRREHD